MGRCSCVLYEGNAGAFVPSRVPHQVHTKGSLRSVIFLGIIMGFKWACAHHRTSCPHCEDPLDDNLRMCPNRLLFCGAILPGVNNDWAYVIDIASIPDLNLLTAQAGSTEVELLCEYFSKTLLSPKTTAKSMLHTHWASVCKLFVLKPSM
jgi:hypothetical protein